MKKLISACAVAAVLTATGCGAENKTENEANAPKKEVVTLQTEQDKQSYAFGVSIGGYLKQNIEQSQEFGISLSTDLIQQAITDTLAGEQKLTDEEAQGLLQKLDQQRKAAVEEKKQADSAKFKDEGAAFLAENAKKEGIQVTESGLQYQVITLGEGEKPSATDEVTVHYTGTLLDGTKFDSSVDRGEPASFPLNRVIKGWTEGLQLMPVGSKYTFYIPYDLAYGDNGTGRIPPYATLVFDVELIAIGK